MRHGKTTAASLVKVLSSLAGVVAVLAGATTVRGDNLSFTERVISNTAFTRPQSVYATDLDGDGDSDVVAALSSNDTIAWYESNGALPPTFTEHVISTIANHANTVFATDVDGDGDIDVLSASDQDHKVAWYENDGGAPPTFTERVISTSAFATSALHAADVDGDGDTDVLSAATLFVEQVLWFENDGGSPPGFTLHVISTSVDRASSVYASDVDGDGDTDVLSSSITDDKIAWYENDGGSPPTFTQRVISTTADFALSVLATDVDGDGDVDVLSASRDDQKIAWYESDGGLPPTFSEHVISTNANGAISVSAADVDGDGDIDVLSASFGDDKIAWYENDGGMPPSFTERVISTSADAADSVFATDVDGDGDTDVLSASLSDDKIAWYENTGPPCGNGGLDPGEECDGGLGCTDCFCDAGFTPTTPLSLDCQLACGNGILDPGEECDDGNGDDGDGCSSGCAIQEGWKCGGQPSVCTPTGVPTIGEWGLIVMANLMLVMGTVIHGRRRPVRV